jgi:hypothetical protein
MSNPNSTGDHVGENDRPEQASRVHGELKITQDVNPSGLGLMPGWMARRIAEMVSRKMPSGA